MSDYLPDDVIAKILRNLPVKSLIQFKCACKRWRSIISDPEFARAHYNQKPPSTRLLVSSSPDIMDSLHWEEEEEEEEGSLSIRGRRLSPPRDQLSRVLGSCNGMICLNMKPFRHTLYIWNPTTGMSRKLPPPEQQIRGIECSGFGYLSAEDDYKLVIAENVGYGTKLDVDVFSFRAQVWKRILSPPLGHDISGVGLLLNEALHWLRLHNRSDQSAYDIMALDLATEQFRRMPLPNSSDFGEMNLCTYGGSLCFMAWKNVASAVCGVSFCIEFWTMSEYGRSGSWTMLYKFWRDCSCNVSPSASAWTVRITPILVMETSAVLAKWTEWNDVVFELVRIEYEEGKCVAIQSNTYNVSDVFVYEESLLWIPDCYGAGEKVKRLITKHQASGSRD